MYKNEDLEIMSEELGHYIRQYQYPNLCLFLLFGIPTGISMGIIYIHKNIKFYYILILYNEI